MHKFRAKHFCIQISIELKIKSALFVLNGFAWFKCQRELSLCFVLSIHRYVMTTMISLDQSSRFTNCSISSKCPLLALGTKFKLKGSMKLPQCTQFPSVVNAHYYGQKHFMPPQAFTQGIFLWYQSIFYCVHACSQSPPTQSSFNIDPKHALFIQCTHHLTTVPIRVHALWVLTL